MMCIVYVKQGLTYTLTVDPISIVYQIKVAMKYMRF